MVEEQSYSCAKCGGPNPAMARVCQWCGATLEIAPLSTPAGLPPIESGATAEDQPPWVNSEPDTLRPSRRWQDVPGWVRGLVVAAFLVVILGVLVAGYSPTSSAPSSSQTPAPSGPSYPVNVTVIRLTSADDICGLNGVDEPGFRGVSNQVSGETWKITAPSGGCTLSGLASETSGIMVFDDAIGPVTLAAGQSFALPVSFEMTELGGPYVGSLVIAVS